MGADSVSQIEKAAQALCEARSSGVVIDPVAQTYGIQGLDAAYEVAAINTRARIKDGARVFGKKIGLTSKAVQQQLGVDQPDFGTLFDDMEYLDGDDVPFSRLMQPKAEAEIAFVVSKDIAGRAPSWGEFLNSLAYALPALEIVDSAIRDWKISLEDTVADNASCGLYVLGSQPVGIDQLDFSAVGMELKKNGVVCSTGSGADCLGHPLRAGWHLSRILIERGDGLYEGEVILSGALGPMVGVEQGDFVQAQIGAVGSVSCRFV